jgi:hypothetical protein
MADQRPLDQHPQCAGGNKGQGHRQEKISCEQRWQIGLEQVRRHPGDVGAQDHELAVRHVDDAHLAEDDRKAERHQHVDGKQDQARKALHDEDGAQIANRIFAEHLTSPPGKGARAASKGRDAGS